MDCSLSSWILDHDPNLRRIPPRALQSRQNGYESNFDYVTLIYDNFRSVCGKYCIAICPPANNFIEIFSSGRIISEDRRAEINKMLIPHDRVLKVFSCIEETDHNLIYILENPKILLEAKDGNNAIFTSNILGKGMKVNNNLSSKFKGKRVILTKNKNNNLRWIKDWVKFYYNAHGADGVLLYDNNSEIYNQKEIYDAIKSVSSDITVEVVKWPFIWGVHGGPNKEWDSDYCQYGILEHARYKYLQMSRSVINCDVDELIMNNDNKSIFEETENTTNGYMAISGFIVPNYCDEVINNFSNYRYLDLGSPALPKWCVVPSKCNDMQQWKVHDISGFNNIEFSNEFISRHFRGINTNWLRKDTKINEKGEKFVLDKLMIKSVQEFCS